jgi:hypothetical protein
LENQEFQDKTILSNNSASEHIHTVQEITVTLQTEVEEGLARLLKTTESGEIKYHISV